MVARLELVRGMPLVPNCCVLCGNNPIDENTGEQLEHIFAPGVDVDWGSSVYVCNACGHIIAELLGHPTTEGFDRLKEKNERLNRELGKVKEDHKKAERLLGRIREGNKALKEAREEVK